MDSLTYNTEEIPNETHCNKDEEMQVETTPTAINNKNDNTNENTIATTTAKIATTAIINSNQETDLEAMSKDLEESTLQPQLPQIKETTNTSTSSEPLTTSYNSNTATDTTLATNICATTATATAVTTTTPVSSNQFVTPQKPENKSIQLHASTSLKKKRNKFSKCLVGNSNNNKSSNSNSNIGGSINVDHHDSSSSLSNVLASNIKTSLSMTSLPPDEKQESRDGIKAKLKVERPYNSLKKNTDRNLTNQLAQMHSSSKNHASSNNKYNRYSWGSGHSSSSLHSSAATLGIGSGKDDLWAAIQTNYNYIMDTNLLDTCKEARCEIEGAVSVLEDTMDKSFKLLDDNNRNVGSCEDPKELRKWLRDMENKLENAPSLSEATMLTCAELESHLNEHTVNIKILNSNINKLKFGKFFSSNDQ
ncbi:putative uncharacterized protein DDB_G0282133 isoform X1 [Lucilia cuprina]|uniref:putative uncharacterized protein DDB_G0282133 isoform X1 n=1 Tax=Lucilia cuprina TaxID=7375 RepID=UPI001F05BA57|nr:putative uncharacterized protein DDB_G0282133 isoform X1 [Lucilia cuprina]